VGIEGDPLGAVAVWLPGMNDRPCQARRTVIGRAAARRLTTDVLSSPAASGISNCPMDDASAVQVWFRTADGPDQTIVVGLRGCMTVWAAGRRPRRASVELLRDLAEVAPRPWRDGLRTWLA
jgi:hypothetical protein